MERKLASGAQRTVIVTGGSRGLGLGMARRLAESGYRVIAVARKTTDAVAAAQREAPADSLHFRAMDLGDIDGIAGFVHDLRQAFGPVYGLVNNAAMGTEGVLGIMHNAQIEQMIRVNTLSPIILTKYVLRAMMADGEGRIVNISSIIASTGYNGLSVYAATKAALVGFTRSLAREAGRVGVTVNAIAPGFIATEMTSGMGEADRDRIARRSALRRLAEVEDVARMAEFLLGEGGRNITGTVLTVDAGNTA